MTIYRKSFANTHFEEWWFKTFYNKYGKAALPYIMYNKARKTSMFFGGFFIFRDILLLYTPLLESTHQFDSSQ